MHRNVIFRNENVTESPVSTYDTGRGNFPLLWQQLRDKCIDADTGCDGQNIGALNDTIVIGAIDGIESPLYSALFNKNISISIMWKNTLLLIVSVVLIPGLAVYLEPPLTGQMQTIFMALLKVYIVATLLCFMVSTIAKNYSQVDKLWSVMPIIYAWIVCVMLDFEPRVLLMAILASIWGIRLTLNFARRGGYSWRFWEGEEDYRWAEVRKRPGFSHPVAWSVFNFAFISFYQMGLILLFTLPILKSASGTEISLLDLVLATVFILLVYLQAIADTQQWNFQTQKYKLLEQGKSLPEEYAHGFVKTGLWSFARHPNYACEQAIWITYYLFSVVATGQWLNWSITGCILLVILFRNSSDLSEEISALKYSKYQNYQNDIPRFLPLKLPK